ncbi:MAG TPA: type I-E CRISPR-associated endoribonuclease Cas2e [Kiritimatiellia bacterium]|nr:type I-E CRISPR-associated endoribonuclease Cas2e [Kiritimatiellia bacterium]HQQ05098.1 type I-E CRISPR-associated endoribonuclease Cas2e [Kiritimatiellia bacterium]
MTVIICNNTPDCIRGHLKRWFIEPKPNVFVGTVNAKTREQTIAYIRRNAKGLGMLIITPERSSQGFSVQTFGETDRRAVQYAGLYLIAEKWETECDPTL